LAKSFGLMLSSPALSRQALPEEFIASSKEIDTFDYLHDRSVLNFGFAFRQATLALSVPPEYTLETGKRSASSPSRVGTKK
jgi:hypothetical protein